MKSAESDVKPPRSPVLGGSWQAMLFLGAATLILGIIVSFHPTKSLYVLAVLLGVLAILSGIYHLIRVFDQHEPHRIFLGIGGVVFIVFGAILVSHLHLTIRLIGVFVGITWIAQGLAALAGGFTRRSRERRGWWVIFGIVSLAAGIVVAVAPVHSLSALAVLLGIWFIVMGIFELIGGFLLRHALRATAPSAR